MVKRVLDDPKLQEPKGKLVHIVDTQGSTQLTPVRDKLSERRPNERASTCRKCSENSFGIRGPLEVRGDVLFHISCHVPIAFSESERAHIRDDEVGSFVVLLAPISKDRAEVVDRVRNARVECSGFAQGIVGI